MMFLVIEQFLNGLQFGLLLFLLAAGLTLVFGIMDFVNLAHGSLYMMGAYFAATFVAWTGSFVLGVAAGARRHAAARHRARIHRAAASLWPRPSRPCAGDVRADPVLQRRGAADLGSGGPRAAAADLARRCRCRSFPACITRPTGSRSSSSRCWWPRLLYLVVMRTRIGMLIRAGASNREMIGALGINIKLLYTLVFGLGAALAGLAGLMQAPILTVQIGMGENILILAFVIIVIGGIGSIRGAFMAAIFVGMIDTIGRAFLPDLLRQVLSPAAASTAAPALSSMLIYLLMAIVLVVRPEGLFPAAKR